MQDSNLRPSACKAEGRASEGIADAPLTEGPNRACTSACTSFSVDALIEAIRGLSKVDRARLVTALTAEGALADEQS